MNFLFLILLFVINTLNSVDFIKCLESINSKENSTFKTAIIFGITGQDGYYLTKFLLDKGYIIYGVSRKITSSKAQNIIEFVGKSDKEIRNNLHLLNGDITDFSFVSEIIHKIKPDEIYNLAAHSSVKASFDEPLYTLSVNGISVLNILIAIRNLNNEKKIRFYQASTCEIFGKVKKYPQNELTSFCPCSPYGIAKACAYWSTVNYREAYNIYACNGILFNHESPFRGENFVTRTITMGIAKIKKGLQEYISLGNLNAKRDWGFAGDYVEAMWLMLQQDTPEDFIIASGEVHSVREFVEAAFQEIGITIEWKGEGIEEVGINKATGKTIVHIDPKYFRPTEADLLIGDSSKAKKKLGWSSKMKFRDLVKIMVQHDLKNICI